MSDSRPNLSRTCPIAVAPRTHLKVVDNGAVNGKGASPLHADLDDADDSP